MKLQFFLRLPVIIAAAAIAGGFSVAVGAALAKPVDEILKQDPPASNGGSEEYSVTTVDGKDTITFDTSAAPELAGWMKQKLAPVLVQWYPKIVALLPSPGFTAPTHYIITVKH